MNRCRLGRMRGTLGAFLVASLAAGGCGARSELVADCESVSTCNGVCTSADHVRDGPIRPEAFWTDGRVVLSYLDSSAGGDSQDTLQVTSAVPPFVSSRLAGSDLGLPEFFYELGVAFDTRSVYVVNYEALRSKAMFTSAPTSELSSVAGIARVDAMVVDDDYVWVATFADSPEVLEVLSRYSKVGGDGAVLWQDPRRTVTSIVRDLDRVVWNTGVSFSTSLNLADFLPSEEGLEVFVSSVQDSRPRRIAQRSSKWMTNLVSDATGVYWAWGDACDMELVGIPSGGDDVVRIARLGAPMVQLAVRGEAFFLLDKDANVHRVGRSVVDDKLICTCADPGVDYHLTSNGLYWDHWEPPRPLETSGIRRTSF